MKPALEMTVAVVTIYTAMGIAGALAVPFTPMSREPVLRVPVVEVMNLTKDDTSLFVLAGSDVELSGYLLPVDREGELVYAFALVPFPGACSHTPQPPPETITLVTPEKPYRLDHVYEHVSVKGYLARNSEVSQFFLADGVVRLVSNYAISGAKVEHVTGNTALPKTPWKFLNK